MCILNHCILKKVIILVLIIENMKEASPEMSSYTNNFTFRCCKSTMFILRTCFKSLNFFVFGVGGILHLSLAYSYRICVWVSIGQW